MENLFFRVLNMSLSAAAVIAVVALVRLLLRSAPKKWRYLLWSAAGFRLCCPVSFKAFFSIFRFRPSAIAAVGAGDAAVLLPQNAVAAARIGIPAAAGMPPAAVQVTPAVIPAAPVPAQEQTQLWPELGILLWLFGMAVMLALGIIRYIRMKRILTDAAVLEKGVFATDRIRMPFILGLLPPRIYLPAGLDPAEAGFVLAHERAHIRRGDHWVKLLAYLLLSIHWFNPAVWAAFFLMSRDMEMSCDERVLRDLTGSAKAYSRTLLRFAEGRQFPAPAPLGFGESDVKSRIKNALRWKRPKLWITLAAIILCISAVAACTADPKEPKEPDASEMAAGDTVRFSRTEQSILLRAVEGSRSFGELVEELAPQGFEYRAEDNFLSLEDRLLTETGALTIGMDKASALQALYGALPDGREDIFLRAENHPGILLGNDKGGSYPLSGLFAGKPFRMTLQYAGAYADLLQSVTLRFWPLEGGEEVYSRLKKVLVDQLGDPDGEGSDDRVSAMGWLFPYGAGALSLQWTGKGSGDQSVIILLSAAMGADTPWSWSSTVKAPDIREAALKSGSAQEEILLTEEQIEELTALLNSVPRDQVVGGRGIPSERVLELRDTGYALRFAGGVIELDGEGPGAFAAAEPAWEIHDEALYAWLDALWMESPFGGTENPLGLTMSAKDVTPTGCTLVFTQSGGGPTGRLQTGAAFLLEREAAEGVWDELPGLRDVIWYSLAYSIPSDGTTTLAADWTHILGPLEAGHYRISKEIMDFRGGGDYDTYLICAEFDIPDDGRIAGSAQFEVKADERKTSAKGTIEVFEKEHGFLGIRIQADLEIGPNDFGGVAFYLPAGCALEDVSCTYPETDGEAGSDPPVNVWSTASDLEKYTAMIEIGRSRGATPGGGGTGMVTIEASYPRESSDPVSSLAFAVECGAEEKDGYVIMGVEYSEIIVEIKSR